MVNNKRSLEERARDGDFELRSRRVRSEDVFSNKSVYVSVWNRQSIIPTVSIASDIDENLISWAYFCNFGPVQARNLVLCFLDS
jgi:hypothetical protein